MWVFDYYYNSFDTTFYSKKSSDWYYKHERAPLLTQICNYFKKNKSNRELLTNYTKKVEQSYIYNSEYFNCVEQLMYVSPAKNIKWIMPTEFHSFIDKTDYFSDLDVYVNKIWKNPTNNIIDCVGVLFLNKCFLNLDNISSNDYKLFLSEIRKIELTTDTKLRACIGSYSSKNNVYNYRPVTSLNKVKREIIEENTFEKQYEYYKKRYLHTRNKKYKTIYKRLKKLK
jgi:hypothetical protein